MVSWSAGARVPVLRAVLGVGLALGAGACETHVNAKFPTASEHPDDNRRPDGVAVDLTSDPPAATVAGHTDDKVLTLRTPLSIDLAMTAVRRFFLSLETEDISAMLAVVDSSALVNDISVGTNRRIHNLTSLWRQRFRKHDYHKLATRLVYREGDVSTYRGKQFGVLPLSVRHLVTVSAGSTDVVLRVPIITHSIKNQRVFGDEIYFWLRRSGDGFRIYRVAEDVPL